MSLTNRIRDFLDEYDAVEEFEDYEQASSFLTEAIRLLREAAEQPHATDYPDHAANGDHSM
ncbi:MAG: hypothetical protein O3A46_00040 [Candidatus Poribacteria bacterium]|nr:hypothetical protein [Candidatus Poribacteria bacterium]